MLPRIIINVILAGGSVLGRAFIDAWRQASIKAAQNVERANKLTPGEALKILGLSKKPTLEEISKRYERLFQVNDPSKGGSFYLQSKVVRAKECLEEALKTGKLE